MAKINVSIDDKLLERVDTFADENYMSRSGLISLACTQFISTNELMSLIKEMAFNIRKIADTQKIDDETIKQLESFELMAKMLVGKK
jgi:metal-responsive CopG/Arc/MetJ family transcriptional regulator